MNKRRAGCYADARRYRVVNETGWDQLARESSAYSRPYGPAEFARATEILDPRGWLPWSRLDSVLCLASAGGQQGPLFASLGRVVTVVDISAEQLQLDAKTARDNGLRIECIQADMMDFASSLPMDRRFDLVYQPVSAIYVPDVRRVYRQVAMVLGPRAMYMMVHWNPTQMQVARDRPWDGEAYRLDRTRYAPPHLWEKPPQDGEAVWTKCMHFMHTLDDLIGGLCESGFVVTRFAEWAPECTEKAPANSIEHLGQYLPVNFTILARRRQQS